MKKKKSTTYTTLKKVCDKGLAQNENTIVTSLVKKEEVQEFESKHIVEESFSGSLPSFLASFFAGKKINLKIIINALQFVGIHHFHNYITLIGMFFYKFQNIFL